MTTEQLLMQVLELPSPARAFIAEKILETLDSESDTPLSDEWVKEILQRAKDIDAGAVEMISAETVFTSIRNDLAA